MINELDTDGNGEVDFNEFVKVISQKVAASFTSDQVKSAFKVFEGSNCSNGEIDRADLVEALTTCGTTKLTLEEANELIKQLEVDADGKIDYDAYVDMMMTD
jgi:calmodulin